MQYHNCLPTFHLHVALKEPLADSEDRPARGSVADGWRRQEELGTGVDLWQLRQTDRQTLASARNDIAMLTSTEGMTYVSAQYKRSMFENTGARSPVPKGNFDLSYFIRKHENVFPKIFTLYYDNNCYLVL